jgi:hypothetical protein
MFGVMIKIQITGVPTVRPENNYSLWRMVVYVRVYKDHLSQVVQKWVDRRPRRKPRGGVAALRRTRGIARRAVRCPFFNNLL